MDVGFATMYKGGLEGDPCRIVSHYLVRWRALSFPDLFRPDSLGKGNHMRNSDLLKFRIVGLVIFLFSLAGCINTETVVQLNADGTGRIVEKTLDEQTVCRADGRDV